MKLHSISCFSVDIPAAGGSYVMSHGRNLSAFPATIVKVTADDGTTGWGEAGTLGGDYLNGFPGSARETVKELAPFVLTCDPMDAGVLADGMDALLIGHLPGKAAIDTAMWDLRGKLLGLPVATLLGGIKQRELGAFQAVSLTSPQRMVEEALSFVDMGFRRFQLKLGDDPIGDAKRTRAVASAVAEFGVHDQRRQPRMTRSRQASATYRRSTTSTPTSSNPAPAWPNSPSSRPARPLPIMMDESAKTHGDVLDGHRLGITDASTSSHPRRRADQGRQDPGHRRSDRHHDHGRRTPGSRPGHRRDRTTRREHRPQRFLGASYFMGDHMPISYQKDPGATGPALRRG